MSNRNPTLLNAAQPVALAPRGFPHSALSPDTVRAPAVSFYSAARVGSRSPDGYFEIPPDLAIEVILRTETRL